jgi:uncharacterized protein
MNILSIDGGGYLGLATVSLLEQTEKYFGCKSADVFDMFCGTSTGAIIALALACGRSASEVRQLYETLGTRVFDNHVPGTRALRTWVRGWFLAMYSNSNLSTALQEAFGDVTLGDLLARRKYVLIPAFNLTTGRPRVFKTDHAAGLSTDSEYKAFEVALASSAAPVYFPVVELRSPTTGTIERSCDGGIFANHPALLAYTEAVYAIKTDPKSLRILSISTPRSSFAEYETTPRSRRLSRGVLGWRGPRLASLFIESMSEISNEATRRLVEAGCGDVEAYERIVLRNPGGLDLDLATKKTTASLITLGNSEAVQKTTREKMAKFYLRR